MRPTRDEYLMELAILASKRTTCIRKGVGCVLAGARGRILAVAYNGVSAGMPHCNEPEDVPVYHDDPRVTYGHRMFPGHVTKKLFFEFRGKQTLSHWPTMEQARYESKRGNKQCTGFDVAFPRACPGHDLPPGQDRCEAVHAEQNAIIQCADTDRIHTAYVTLAPCRPCMKLLLNTGCQEIVYMAEHPGSEEVKAVWESTGRTWRCFDYPLEGRAWP